MRTHDTESAIDAKVPTLGELALRYVDERRRLGQLTGESPRTIRYRLDLFVDFLGFDTRIRSVTRRRVERWLIHQRVSNATLRVRLSAVRGFLNWCVTNEYLSHNPAVGIEPARQPHLLPPRALSFDQVRAVYLACPNVRAELIVTLMVQEGLRAGEVARLEVGDVDLNNMTLSVTGKGGHQRAIPITSECERVLRVYLGERRFVAGPLVRSLVDEHRGINAGTVSRLVATVMHDAGLGETGHALRHTCASDLLDRGVHVRTVQYILGHSSLQTTQRYLRRHVGDLREAMEGRSYRS